MQAARAGVQHACYYSEYMTYTHADAEASPGILTALIKRFAPRATGNPVRPTAETVNSGWPTGAGAAESASGTRCADSLSVDWYLNL